MARTTMSRKAVERNPGQMNMLTVDTLRQLFRGLQQWQEYFVQYNVDVIRDKHGEEYHLEDIKYLYRLSQTPGVLSDRQSEAIRICLYENMLEKDAAVRMNVSSTNPVMMYAAQGITRLLNLIEAGRVPRFVARPESYNQI